MKSYAALAVLASVFLPGAAMADTVLCKASVQDVHGIATGWIASDGQNAVPVRATFVFPSGQVPAQAKAKGFKLKKPGHLPEQTVFVSAEFSFSNEGSDLRIQLEKVEVDGPAYRRPDGAEPKPLFLLSPGDDEVVREDAVEEDGGLSLRLYPTDGKSTRGDIHMLEEERPALAKIINQADTVVVAAADLDGKTGIIYQTALNMTDAKTRNTMVANALKKAAAAVASGDGCAPAE
jgi:hypothetical protein